MNAPEWYDGNPDLTQFYQGDILRDIPFPRWPMFLPEGDVMPILRPLKPNQPDPTLSRVPIYSKANSIRQTPDAFAKEDRSELVIAGCQLRTVMILTRACQLDYKEERKHVIVAPVTAINDLPAQGRSEDKLKGMRDGEIPHLFYLPEGPGMRESVADFLKMNAIHRSFFHDRDVNSQLVTRLTAYGTTTLQQRLSGHFGMKFGFDQKDQCPQDGLYSCATCFHVGNPVVQKLFREGMIFGACPNCGESASYVKLPAPISTDG